MASKSITKNLLKGFTCENCWFYHALLRLCRKNPEKPKRIPKLRMCKSFDEVKNSQSRILRETSEMMTWDETLNVAKALKNLLKTEDSDWRDKKKESFDTDI